jgi:hypothetical protein
MPLPLRWSQGGILYAGQSHLIFGVGSTSHAITRQFSKLFCIESLYKLLENLDAIALAHTLVYRFTHVDISQILCYNYYWLYPKDSYL